MLAAVGERSKAEGNSAAESVADRFAVGGGSSCMPNILAPLSDGIPSLILKPLAALLDGLPTFMFGAEGERMYRCAIVAETGVMAGVCPVAA